LQRWFDNAEEHLGRSLGDVLITTVEFNRDFIGIQLDGSLHCYTRNDLNGFVERLYQRDDSLRHEYKVSRKMSVTQFEALLDRGPLEFGLASSIHLLLSKFDALVQAQKFQNRRILEIENKLNYVEAKLPSSRRIDLLLDSMAGILIDLINENAKKKFAEGFTCVEVVLLAVQMEFAVKMSMESDASDAWNVDTFLMTQNLHM
jgi:hypothetical protein